ncbi:MAG TPA: ATP-dependent DNA helicase RecG [Porphyromonadaceae bacterium]|nr:ATP-dependent DNA helicase RecG [Porphyromonadaceae bacterium]
MSFLDTDIKYLKGVGDKRAQLLDSELDIRTFGDLLYTFPYRYVDTSRFYKISEFSGEMPSVQVLGRFVGFTVEGEGLRQRLKGSFYDGSRFMEVVWFSKVNFFMTAYQPGVSYILFGKPTQFRDIWQMAHPEVSAYDATRPPEGFRGVYTIPDKLRKKGYSTRLLSDLVKNLFNNARIGEVGETLPAEIIDKYSLMPLREALGNIHFPQNPDRLQKARERMKFEELFYLQLHILRYSRERGRRIRGHVLAKIGDYFNTYYSRHIPFELTGAQKRVLREIRNDMRTGRQMNRLLQGDVGSGKTMVAFMTMLMAADNGFQSAIMAPTEILASQHFETIRVWGEAIGLRVALLTGNTRAKARREIHEGLQSGDIDIIVGTHALIEDNVQFRNLGLTVIDEQHRFGVAQRAKMWKKSAVAPHVLVMTATPIPRTLAMTVYGDLDVSVIDELPPGRKPVQTWLKFDNARMEVNRLINRELKAGRQIYIVYPLVKENPKLELKSVEQGLERVRGLFPDVKVCMVHGQMKPAEKDYQMEQFVSGSARILVATTVIEVGVNVPNASVMVIENAERFGLSQLHQLRGRVGRGADCSYCILMTRHNIAGDTRKRLSIMTETTDGFLISEADMKMRGPGDMEGTQQSGIAFNLRIANLASDGQILNVARQGAEAVLNAHPELLETPAHGVEQYPGEELALSPESLGLVRTELRTRFSKTYDWSQIS